LADWTFGKHAVTLRLLSVDPHLSVVATRQENQCRHFESCSASTFGHRLSFDSPVHCLLPKVAGGTRIYEWSPEATFVFHSYSHQKKMTFLKSIRHAILQTELCEKDEGFIKN